MSSDSEDVEPSRSEGSATDVSRSETTDEQRYYEDGQYQRKRPPEEPVDYSPSSGAQDTHKGYNDSAPHSHDGRAQTRTKFYAEEGNDNIDYARLAKLNDGLHDNYSEGRKNKAERRRDMDIFTSTVNFNETDSERCQYLLESVDDVNKHRSGESLILAIITLVANENDRMIRQEDTFQELCDNCNVTRQQIRNSRERLRDIL